MSFSKSVFPSSSVRDSCFNGGAGDTGASVCRSDSATLSFYLSGVYLYLAWVLPVPRRRVEIAGVLAHDV